MVLYCTCSCSFLKLLVFLFMLWFVLFTSEAQIFYYVCPNTTTFNPNSTYQANLNTLLSTLSSNNTRNDMFYNATAGNSTSERAYGLFMCRGDVTLNTCHDCVVTATRKIKERCPREKVAYIWYNNCMLRYENRSFFSTMDAAPTVYKWKNGTVTDRDRVMQVLGNAMDDLAARACKYQSAKAGQLKGFAKKKLSVTNFTSVYGVAQCTPDISETLCSLCFRVAIAQLTTCCFGKYGGRVLLPSCNIRFGISRFQNFIATVPPTPIPTPSLSPGENARISAGAIIAIIVTIIFSLLLFIFCLCFLRRRQKKHVVISEGVDGYEISKAESLQYNLSTIRAATNNFSSENKVGVGGFGDVFKGILSNGKEIAVKRLSTRSGQGVEEFKNEIVLIAKLQHKNLVRLVGFCLERKEKILIYEFVPNKSLDYFLFDHEKQHMLDWPRRYKIISEIAQGILYLHEYSRLRIIYRDLKASNVLLDGDMNPKISDFGLARIFGVDQYQANTNKVVGTLGYMAPEYLMHGLFSIKSDVFSFGVIILEIVSGRKSNSFYKSGGSENLLSNAWKFWRDGTPMEFVDPTLGDSIVRNEVIRCINIGLLCVQEDAEERPTMALLLHMLTKDSSVSLPLPQQPAFLINGRMESVVNQLELNGNPMPCSVNGVSISEFYPR